jgi:hypothetical protein
VPTVLKSESLNLLKPTEPFKACNGIALPLPLPLKYTPVTFENEPFKGYWLRDIPTSLTFKNFTVFMCYVFI